MAERTRALLVAYEIRTVARGYFVSNCRYLISSLVTVDIAVNSETGQLPLGDTVKDVAYQRNIMTEQDDAVKIFSAAKRSRE